MSVLNKPWFHDEKEAFKKLESVLWPEGPVCPHCGNTGKHYDLNKTRVGLRKCGEKACRKQFTVRVGTVFESSHIPLHKWFQAVHLLCSSKKGISSHQLHRVLEVTYKTAWFMSHRIREAMRSGNLGPMGGSGGVVEVDDTFIGRKKAGKPGRGGHGHKNAVLTLVSRGGEARSFHMDNGMKSLDIVPLVRANLSEEARVMTDTAPSSEIPARFAHGEVSGVLASVGHWRGRPAIYLRTLMYGNVWCLLPPHLVDEWGDATKVSTIWQGRRLSVSGKLIYWHGGRLARIEVESVRERLSQSIDIREMLDPDFTSGLDPVEYLERLHEGRLG